MGRIASVFPVLLLLAVAACGPKATGGAGGGNAGTGGADGGSGGSGGYDPGPGGTGGDLCMNGVHDPGELGVDCGGVCRARCRGGEPCVIDDDCRGGQCDPDRKTCVINCSDHDKNGAETDIDCGGTCAAKCGEDKHCLTQEDCITSSCVAVGGEFLCKPATCSDRQKNQDEGDIDCGGAVAMCPPCDRERNCNRNADCASGNCGPDGFCKAPTCDDSVLNQDETSTDCGGAICSGCADGLPCKLPTDCKSNICSGDKVCIPATCSDKVTNQDETDKDCGGTTCATRCADSAGCKVDDDCLDKVCQRDQCAVPTCIDLHQNGKETDVDCGGADASGGCPPCDANLHCGGDGDCKSKNCVGGVCQPVTCDDGIQNGDEGAIDCGGSDPRCPRCADLSPCLADTDCLDKVCFGLVCAPPTCDDGASNGTETGLDCGGPIDGDACKSNADCHQGATCQGGKCGCPRCPNEQGCKGPDDCVTRWCPDTPLPGGICKPTPCGNGKIEGNEECDDGPDNTNDTDGCSNTCTLPRCGDGIVQVIATNKDGSGYRTASFDDTTPMYFINPDRVRGRVYDKGSFCAGTDCKIEIADDTASEHALCQALGYGMATHVDWGGSDGDTDNPMLRAANWSCSVNQDKAGNTVGYTCAAGKDMLTLPPDQPPAAPGNMLRSISCQGEQCDDGAKNSNDANACRPDCHYGTCGDGVIDDKFGEACDDGAKNSDTDPDACRSNCKKAHCGDGVVDAGEACDDGNNLDGDCCNSSCTEITPC